MPTTVATALVFVVAVVPGALGSYLYRAINGLDWRERDWHAAVRYVGFSALGLTLYVLAAGVFGWWPAIHVIPTFYQAPSFSPDQLPRLLVPYSGHLMGGGVAGVATAYLARVLAKISTATARPSAWDVFVNESMPGRWLVLTLKSGDVYAGYVRVADAGVAAAERDIVLREPARLDPATGNYLSTPYRDMFVSATLVESAATVQTATDARIGPQSGAKLFEEEAHDRQDPSSSASAPTRPG